MSGVSEGKSMMEKLLEVVCEMMTESTVAYGKKILASEPTYELSWEGEKRTREGLKLSFPITEGISLKRKLSVDTNATLIQHLALKEHEFKFQKVVGLLKAITEQSRSLVPCEVQYGTIIDHPIPAGLILLHEGYSSNKIRVVPNRSDSPPASDANPFVELVRFEASNHHWIDSKMISHLGNLPKDQSWFGGPPILGNTGTEYKLRFPRAIIAIPYGMKTILTVSSQLRIGDTKKPKIEFQGKKLKVMIGRPKMSDLKHYLGVLQQMAYLVEHIGYSIETYNEFKSDQFDLPISLAQTLDHTSN
jgi:hypothetical protein